MADEGQDELPDRSLDVIGGVAEFEEALRSNRDFIVKNLNVMNLLINPVSFKDIISEDEQGSIRSCYESNMTEKAAKMFIDAILRSNDETKWSVFKDALEWSEGLELIKDILCKGETKSLINHEADQAQVNLQRGRLAHQWEAELVANGLLEEQMLTSQEYEEVIAKHHNNGNCAANNHILLLVIRKKGFLAKLMKVLWNLDKKKCVKEMDADFYIKMVAESGITSKVKNLIDPRDCDNSNENATAVNFMGYHSLACDKGNYSMYDEQGHHSIACDGGHYNINNVNGYENNNKKIINTANKMGNYNQFNLETQDDNEPVASRTRSKTKLRQMKDPDETLLKQPVLDHRPSDTSHKQMKTLPTEKVVKQYPVSDSSAASKQCVQLKDAPTNARLQGDNKQTNQLQMKDPDETLLKQPILDHRPSGTSHKPREILPVEQVVIQHPVYYSSGASNTCVQFKGAVLEVRLQEDNKQTNQLQMKDPYETVLMLPVFHQRQSGAPQKPRETLPAEQVVTQHPISHPSGAIRKCVKGKDTVVKARLQENKKQTQTKQEVRLVACVCKKRFTSEDALRKHQSTDCQVTFGHDHDKTSPLFRLQENNKQGQHEVRLVACVCKKRFTSEDALRKHQSTDCQVTFGHDHDKTSPLFRLQENNKQRQQEVRLAACVCKKRFTSEVALRNHQRTDCQVTFGHDHDKTSPLFRLQENNKQTQEVRLVACVCKKRFTSEAALRNHQRTDCQVTFGHDHDKTSPPPSRANCATFRTSPNILSREYSGDKNERQENKLLPAKRNVKRCTCGSQFVTQEALDRHRSLDCKDRQTVPEDTMSRSFSETKHPLTKTKSKQQDFPSHHIKADNEKQTLSLDNLAHSGGATSNAPQNTIPHNDKSNDQILNTENEETPQNNRDIGFTQQIASASGFGFQSSRTLQLHRKP